MEELADPFTSRPGTPHAITRPFAQSTPSTRRRGAVSPQLLAPAPLARTQAARSLQAKDAMRRDGGPPHSFVNLLRPLLRKENCEWTTRAPLPEASSTARWS